MKGRRDETDWKGYVVGYYKFNTDNCKTDSI